MRNQQPTAHKGYWQFTSISEQTCIKFLLIVSTATIAAAWIIYFTLPVLLTGEYSWGLLVLAPALFALLYLGAMFTVIDFAYSVYYLTTRKPQGKSLYIALASCLITAAYMWFAFVLHFGISALG